MIRVVLTGLHDYTVGRFLDVAGAPLRGTLCAEPYDVVFRQRALPGGTYVLSDFERLSPARQAHAAELADALAASESARLLNHPARALDRFRLLRRLHDEGLNPYTVHRLGQLPEKVRYPVFLRLEDDHSGARSDLLRSRDEIDAAAARLKRRGKAPSRMIVVEFQDTIDGKGEYRKYGAFCVAGRIVPRHLFFGRGWNLKGPSNHRDEQFDEEQSYMEGNPHEAQLREIFSRAGVDFGRIDYAMVDGRVCTWEINTNPMIAIPEDPTTGRAGTLNALFHERFRDALRAIDTPSVGHVALPRMRVGMRETLREHRDRLKRRLRGR